MDACKVMTDTLHFVMNHSTALIFGIFVHKSAIGSIGRRRAVCLQTGYSAPAVNQTNEVKKKKTNNFVYFFAVADKNYNVFICFQRTSVQLGSLIFTG